MAVLPSPETTGDLIIEIVKGMNVRAGEIAPLMAIQQKLGTGYRADEINDALGYLQSEGLIEPARAGFIKLTQKGYGEEPSVEEIARAVLDEVGTYGIRPDEVIPVKAIAPRLMQSGYKGEEIGRAFDHLATVGHVELRDGTPFLTNSGFAAI